MEYQIGDKVVSRITKLDVTEGLVYEVIGKKTYYKTTYLEILDDAKETNWLAFYNVTPYSEPSSQTTPLRAPVRPFPKETSEVTIDIEEGGERDTTYFLSIESEGVTDIELSFFKELSQEELLKVLEILT